MSQMNELQKLKFLSTLAGFSSHYLGMDSLYPWQIQCMDALDAGGRVAVRAPNGSGKSSFLVVPAIIWHCAVFPNSYVIVTSNVGRQIKSGLFATVHKYASKLKGWTVNSNELISPINGRAVAFTTDEPQRMEGWHPEGSTTGGKGNLMLIYDEAKSIPAEIWHAGERTQPNRWLAISSTGSANSFFAKCFREHAKFWKTFTIPIGQCPHITDESIRRLKELYGDDHPLVRSMIHNEFVDEADNETVISETKIHDCRATPPTHFPMDRVAFIDWGGAGVDETAVAIMDGNKLMPLIIIKDRDEMRTVGRVIRELRAFQVNPKLVWADNGGIGSPMIRRMDEQGYSVNRVNFGTAGLAGYANKASEMLFTAGKMIEDRGVILPKDDIMDGQLCTRRFFCTSNGSIKLESKAEYKQRTGGSSPDRADAAAGAIWAYVKTRPSLTSNDAGGSHLQTDVFGNTIQTNFEDARSGFDAGD